MWAAIGPRGNHATPRGLFFAILGSMHSPDYQTEQLSLGLKAKDPAAIAELRRAARSASGPVDLARRLGIPYRTLCRWRREIPVVNATLEG